MPQILTRTMRIVYAKRGRCRHRAYSLAVGAFPLCHQAAAVIADYTFRTSRSRGTDAAPSSPRAARRWYRMR